MCKSNFAQLIAANVPKACMGCDKYFREHPGGPGTGETIWTPRWVVWASTRAVTGINATTLGAQILRDMKNGYDVTLPEYAGGSYPDLPRIFRRLTVVLEEDTHE